MRILSFDGLAPPARWPVAAVAALGAALVCALWACGCDRRAPRPATRPAGGRASPYDKDYVAASAAATDFCTAWRARDLAAGRALLSLRVRRTFTDAQIRDAIVGSANPSHAGFELLGGTREAAGRIVFRVRLFYGFAGRADDRIEAPTERIVLVRDKTGRWSVDEFPLLVEQTG